MIPKRQSEDTKEAIGRYQRGNQKIPKRQSEDTRLPLWYHLIASLVTSEYLFDIF
jgi:hypothetical protein